MVAAVTKRKVNVKFLVNSGASEKTLMLNALNDLVGFGKGKIEAKLYSVS